MKKIIPIIIFVLLIGVVAGTYLFGTNNQEGLPVSDDYEENIQLLNDSDEVTQVEITEIDKKVNKEKSLPTVNSSDIIPIDQIKEAYEKIFEYENATVDVSGPYQMDNGTIYYSVLVHESFDEGTFVMHIEADAKTMPEVIPQQNLVIKGVLSVVFSGLYKDEGNEPPKLSTEDIAKIAKEDIKKYYKGYINISENTPGVNPNEYRINLYYTQLSNQPVYRVDYGNELVHMMYDANTGELIYRDVFGYGYEGLYESLGLAEAIRLGHIELTKYCESNNLPELDMDELGNYTNDAGQVVFQFKLYDDSKVYGTMDINSVTQEVTINIDDTNDTVTVDENMTVEDENETTESAE